MIEEPDDEVKLLTNEYEIKIHNMALMEQQYGNVITKMLNDRNDDKTIINKLMKELTELQIRYEETSKEFNVVEKELSSNKAKNLSKKSKTSKNTNQNMEKNYKNKNHQKQLDQVTTELSDAKSKLKEKEKI